MTAPRYEDWQLRRMAGDTTYARGAAYAKQGRVKLLSLSRTTARAEVQGSELYHVMLEGEGDDIWKSQCDCIAYEDRGFCKHCVAVALAVNAAAPEAAAAVQAQHQAIRSHLLSLSREELAERLLALAERDAKVWKTLELEVAVASEDVTDLSRQIAEQIDGAVDIPGYINWRGAGAVADALREAVEPIERLVTAGRADVALPLLERLFDAAPELQEAIDDSDGEISGVLLRARELHMKACAVLRLDPLTLASRLFERDRSDGYGLWEGSQSDYEDVLGPEGLGEYRRLATERWAVTHDDGTRTTLDWFAVRDGDLDARIALRSGDAHSGWHYVELAELCRNAGRQAEALKWAEEGLWRTEDRPDERLVRLAAELMRGADRGEEATALLWRMFERAATVELYQALVATTGDRPTVTDRCSRILSGSLDRRGDQWSARTDLLVEILRADGRLDEAWSASDRYRCSDGPLSELAKESEELRPARAIAAYEMLTERAVSLTNNGAYDTAVGYVVRLERIRRQLGRGDEQATYVNTLAARHKMKRNFIKRLQAAATPA